MPSWSQSAPAPGLDRLAGNVRAELGAAEHVHDVDRLVDLGQGGDPPLSEDLNGPDRPNGNHVIPLLEQVVHDGVTRASGPRRRSDERNRPGIGEDLGGSARHGRRLSFGR